MTKGKRMRFREVRRLREFERDLKKLLKKYSTLEADDRIELVEIYLKADKNTEDRKRILKYYRMEQ